MQLENLRNSSHISTLNIQEAVSCLDDAYRDMSNPMKPDLPLTSKNIFIDIINFAMENNKDLLYTLLCLTTSPGTPLDEVDVIHVAKLYMGLGSKAHQKNNTFLKLNGIFLQSCGLTETGITVLNKLGESAGVKTLRTTRTQLAIADEIYMKNPAKMSSIAIVLDNLDTKVNNVLQHQTLPVLLSRSVPQKYDCLPENRKSVEEAMQYFKPEFLDLDCLENSGEKKSFMEVNFQ